MRWACHGACTGEMRNTHKILAGRSDGKRPLESCMFRWDDNIRTDIKKTGWEGVNWIYLAQDSDQW